MQAIQNVEKLGMSGCYFILGREYKSLSSRGYVGESMWYSSKMATARATRRSLINIPQDTKYCSKYNKTQKSLVGRISPR